MISEKAVYSIILILIIAFLYNSWDKKQQESKKLDGYNIVEKFFLSDTKSLATINKPIIWIHVTYDWNARKWQTFGSRMTMNLNQDYLYLTLRSIIEKYGNDFHICLINDNSFDKLLPNWPIDLAFSPDPVRERLRNLGLAYLLYNYGGIVLPVSFIAENSFLDVYNKLNENDVLIGELVNTSNTQYKYYPNSKILGCKAGCYIMEEYIAYLENLYSNNFTDSIQFDNSTNEWFLNYKDNLVIISPELLGAKDHYGSLVNIDRLLSNTFLNLEEKRYGIYIPSDELLKRNNYNWFVYLNINEVLNSETQIGKYILISQ
tara:strand:- start:135 stop:1088 length:954 start_codon:yes stop_codon:yes gene_type:complete